MPEIVTGQMVPWLGAEDNVPTDYLPCTGGEADRVLDAALFAILGEGYGAGNGVSSFNLPSAGHVAIDEQGKPFGCWIIKR